MRIRAGSQAKTGMAEEKETKGIDYQTWEFTGREYLEIAGISLGIAAAVNLLLPGVVGMHCCGSGWNRMFSHVSEKPDSETERGAVRQLPGSDCVDAHGTAFRLFHGKCSAGGGRTAGTVAGKRKHSGTGTAPDAS